jgi:preprotein translocase subunit SecD
VRRIGSIVFLLMLSGCAPGQEEAREVTVEFRLAESEPTEGLTEITLASTGEKFYLHKEALMTHADIASASVVRWKAELAVEVIFTDAGREKFARLTADNVMKRLGMMVDGQLVVAPIIRAPILEGRAIINGNFTEEEAQRIANGIVGDQ